jgi:hypothetical protein
MRAPATQVEARHGGTVIAVAGDGPEGKHLIRRELALHDVAAEEPEPLLDVLRRQHLHVFHRTPQVRRELAERLENALAVRRPLLVPRPLPELVGPVLREGEHDVLSLRGQPVLVPGGEDGLEIGMFARAAVLRIVPRALQVLDRRRHGGEPEVHVALLVPRRKPRQLRQSHVDLHRARA